MVNYLVTTPKLHYLSCEQKNIFYLIVAIYTNNTISLLCPSACTFQKTTIGNNLEHVQPVEFDFPCGIEW